MRKFAWILACLVLMIPSLSAAVILSPVAAVSSVGNFPGCCQIELTIDQSGLLTPFVSGVTDFDVYGASAPLHGSSFAFEWFAPEGVLAATVTYDLGSVYSASAIAFWNEDGAGTAMFDLTASEDAAFTSPIFLGTLYPTDHALSVDYFADVYGGAPVLARYFRLDVLGVQGQPYVSIGEVAFRVDQVVPEPGTVGLLGAGLAALALVARRRRS